MSGIIVHVVDISEELEWLSNGGFSLELTSLWNKHKSINTFYRDQPMNLHKYKLMYPATKLQLSN